MSSAPIFLFVAAIVFGLFILFSEGVLVYNGEAKTIELGEKVQNNSTKSSDGFVKGAIVGYVIGNTVND